MRHNHLLNLLSRGYISQSHIDTILDSTNEEVYWKDRKGAYMGANYALLYSAGLKNEMDIIGKHDANLVWSTEAPFMEKNDQEVIVKETSKIAIEKSKCSYDDQIHTFLSYKIPLKNNIGKTTGAFGISFILDGDKPATSLLAYPPSNSVIPYQAETKLSTRQIECLLLLIKGMTLKQIAYSLKLSARTVEHYIETVKTKLNCFSRVELITKALQMPEIKKLLYS